MSNQLACIKSELSPSIENITSTLVSNALKRNIDVERFIKCLENVSGNTSISLDGDWGCGKTFFVKQTKLVLDTIRCKSLGLSYDETVIENYAAANHSNCKIKAFYYDAWKNDADEEPVLSIIYRLLENEYRIGVFQDKDSAKERLIKTTLALADMSGFNFTSLYKAMTEADFSQQKILAFEKEKEFENNIREFFSLLSSDGFKVVVFIDELDRCKPTYAVKLLERIKHYFDDTGVIFVFSTNLKELSNTVRAYYGEKFNAELYLDRFFDLKYSLRNVSLDDYFSYISDGQSDDILSHAFTDCVKTVAQHFNMNLREVRKYYKMCLNGGCIRFADGYTMYYNAFVILLIALKYRDAEEYNRFINGRSEMWYRDFLNAHPDYLRYLGDYFSGKRTNLNDMTPDDIKAYVDLLTKQYLSVFKSDVNVYSPKGWIVEKVNTFNF